VVWNVSRLSRSSVLGRLLRWPLHFLPAGLVVRIVQGPGRGLKWVVGAGVHGYWLGTFELEKQMAIWNELRPGSVFFDVGANVGFFSLLAARRVGASGRVVAFEPLPENVAYLRQHARLNGFAQRIQVVAAAVGAACTTADFEPSPNRSMGHLAEGGSLSVPVLTLDAYLEGGGPPPDVIKIDVEGAELQLLEGAAQLFARRDPVVFLATHGPELVRGCRDWFLARGRRMAPLMGRHGVVEGEFVVTTGRVRQSS